MAILVRPNLVNQSFI